MPRGNRFTVLSRGEETQDTLSTVLFCLQTMFAVPMSPAVENLTPSLVTEIITATHGPEAAVRHVRNRDGKCSRFFFQETGIQHTSVADAVEILADPLRPPPMPKLWPLLEQQVHHLVLQPHTNATQSDHTRQDREIPSRCYFCHLLITHATTTWTWYQLPTKTQKVIHYKQ